MTNAEIIRQMTNEELAEFIQNGCEKAKYNYCDKIRHQHYGLCEKRECVTCWLEWLKQEPGACEECPLIGYDYNYCIKANTTIFDCTEKQEWCPLTVERGY